MSDPFEIIRGKEDLIYFKDTLEILIDSLTPGHESYERLMKAELDWIESALSPTGSLTNLYARLGQSLEKLKTLASLMQQTRDPEEEEENE